MTSEEKKFTMEEFQKKHEIDYFISLLPHKPKKARNSELKNDTSRPRLYIRQDAEKGSEEIIFPKNYTPIMLPSQEERERDVIYACGQAGAGKTFLANYFAKAYRTIYPERNIYFITTNNPRIDVSLTHSLYTFLDFYWLMDLVVKHPQSFADTQFHDCLVIFDDIGGARHTKETEKALWYLIDMLSEHARKRGVSVYVINHVSTNYKQTSVIIKELHKYIIYPQTLQVYSDRVPKAYMGLNEEETKRALTSNSRFVIIDSRKFCCVTEHKLYKVEYDKNKIKEINKRLLEKHTP